MYGPYEIIYSKIQERFPFCLFMLSLPNKTCWGFKSVLCDLQNELNFCCTQTVLDAYDKLRECSLFSCLFFAMNPKVFSNFESQIWYFPTGVDDGWLAGSPTNLGQGLRKSNIWCSSNGDLACFSGSRIKRNLIGICLNWGRKSEDPQATAF